LQAFLKGLGEVGFFDGQNVTIEYRWARGEYGRLPALAAEFVQRRVNVLATTGGEPSALAANKLPLRSRSCLWRVIQSRPAWSRA
jgi:putative ABC transport system substrate-binding protein